MKLKHKLNMPRYYSQSGYLPLLTINKLLTHCPEISPDNWATSVGHRAWTLSWYKHENKYKPTARHLAIVLIVLTTI